MGSYDIVASSHSLSDANAPPAPTAHNSDDKINQNELVAAYNELREECAQKYFHKSYNELDEDQQKKIQKIYPQKISEAEPKNYGN